MEAHARLPTNYEVRTFKSFYNLTNLIPIVEKYSITTVPVYIDVNDPDKYFMDLEPLRRLDKH